MCYCVWRVPRIYDCNNINFTDCEIAETDIDSSSNEEDDFNNENMFERICSEFQFIHSVFINFFRRFDLYLEIMKEYNLKLKHVGITKNNVEFQYISVCNFQSMKSPVELNSLFSKFFCYITWFVISPDQTQHWTTCKRGLYVKILLFLPNNSLAV